MSRTGGATLGVAAALVAACAAPLTWNSASAIGAVETCQGQPATHVGGSVDATEGDDVIVATLAESGPVYVYAHGGDDLICLRGDGDGFVVLNSGDGDDSVTIETGQPVDPYVVLGPGDDRYVGGPGSDHVTEYDPAGSDEGFAENVPDSGDDLVRTLGGDDVVLAGGRAGPPQTDGIDLGPGDDELRIGKRGTTPQSRLRGGPGRDQLVVLAEPGRRVVLDATQRRATTGSRVLARAWTDFQDYGVTTHATRDNADLEPHPSAVTVRGSAGPETVTVLTYQDPRAPAPLDVVLGGGDDLLVTSGATRGRADGGAGRDEIGVVAAGGPGPRGATTRLDLARGRVTLDGNRGGLTLLSFQDAFVRRVPSENGPAVVVGDGRANRLRGCAVLSGGGGDDLVSQIVEFAESPCSGFRAYGGAGRDRLVGSARNDLLVGGPGSDTAVGLDGTDTCRAERRVSCERR